MKSLQDYIDIYKDIAKKLNIQGDSVEILSQLLANATYINEVENISYAQEASLEKSTLINSKIQHCMDNMYSVFRGSCPRVILRFKPQKYFSFNPYDEIISMNKFKIYYLGYLNEKYSSSVNEEGTPIEDGFVYSPISIPPGGENDYYTIIGLLSQEVVKKSWVLNESNTYYVDCTEEDLSNDFWVKVGDSYFEHTRDFSEHITENKIFDLTLPSYGSRLYVADILGNTGNITKNVVETPANTKIEALYYVFSQLSEYNSSDLKKISIKGAELVDFDKEWLSNRGVEQYEKGICYISESPKDTSFSVHYKANRDRFVNSILRSNSDVGTVLEEAYPDKIISGGTSYKFESGGGESVLNIYYVPVDRSNLLTDQEIQEYINEKTSYYVTDNIKISKGNLYIAVFNLSIELYQSSSIDDDISSILSQYENKFEINLEESIEEIKSLISKIPNVKQIIEMSIIYSQEDGTTIDPEEVSSVIDPSNSYFDINFVLSSIIRK